MRSAVRPALLLLVAAACAGCHAPAGSSPGTPGAPGLLAGAAKVEITPDLNDPDHPVYMAGMDVGLKATSIHDPLYARALVLTDRRGYTVGLVVLDLIGFFHDDVVAVREELARTHPEAAIDYLAVASTHTHAGPDVLGLWRREPGGVDEAYVTRVRTAAAEAADAAWKARRPAEMYAATASVPGLAKDTRLPILIDETLLVLGLRAPGGGAGIATLVNWNSHPSVAGGGNSKISADFPGALVARMEREWGGTGLYVSGDLGGQIGSRRAKIRSEITGKKIPSSSMQLVEALGEKLAGIALGALDEAVPRGPEPAPRIDVRDRPLRVPLDNPAFVQALALGVLQPRKLYPSGGGDTGWLPSALPDPSSFKPGAYDLSTEAAVVDLGSVAWALVPGELYPEIALGQYQTPQDPGADFQGAPHEPGLRALAGKPLFIVCLANDELGYIIPKSEWDSEPPFAYGRKEKQYGERVSAGPETAPLVMEAFEEMMGHRAAPHPSNGASTGSGR